MLRAHTARATAINILILASFVALAGARIVRVSSSPDGIDTTSLLDAVRDPDATRIVVLGYITVGHDFDAYVGKGLPVSRNVTVSGAEGLNSVLNLNFVRSAVKLCMYCTWTFDNITVENDRRGTGGLIDFFLGTPTLGNRVGGPSSRVLMNDVYRLRPACTAAQQSSEVVNATARSLHWPNANGPQLTSFRTVTFQGRSFPDSLYLTDFSTDDPPRVQEGRGAFGGYAIRNTNTTRLCRYLVDPACLQVKSSDSCVNDLVDAVLSGQMEPASSSCSHPTAAVIAGAVVAGAVGLAAALGLLLWRRRRQRLHKHQSSRHVAPHKHYGLSGVSGNIKDTEHRNAPEYDGSAGGPGSAVAPFPERKGWEVTRELTTPLQQGNNLSQLQFGELLGAGSFGRVYKAEWAGRQLAVKVIEHNGETSTAVENEVELMLSFNHPNIVQAYYCVTFTKSGASTTPHGTGKDERSTAGPQSISQAPGSQRRTGIQHSQSPAQNTPARAQRHCRSWPGILMRLQTSTQASNVVQSAALPSRNPATNDSAASVAVGRSAPAVVNVANRGTGDVATDGSIQSMGRGTGAADASASWRGAAPGTAAAGAGAINTGGSLGMIADSSKSQQAETWIVQEYCDCGTLVGVASQWALSQGTDQQMVLRLLLLQDCAQGLEVLHGRNVVHGDLNARNVLVTSSPSTSTGLCAKLADLGLSRVLQQDKTHQTTNTVGTMSHMPPELLRYGRMSAAADIYAFGVMMWEIFTQQAAFRNLHYGQFYETVVLRNLRPMIPDGMPADYRLLMEHCWATAAADRPSIDRVLECLRYMIHERQQAETTSPLPTDAQSQLYAADRSPSILMRQPQERISRFGIGAVTSRTSSAKTPKPDMPGSGAEDDLARDQSSMYVQGYQGLYGSRASAGSPDAQIGLGSFVFSKAGTDGTTETKGDGSYADYGDGDADMAGWYAAKLQPGQGAAGPGVQQQQHFNLDSSRERDTNQGLHMSGHGSDEFNNSNIWFV